MYNSDTLLKTSLLTLSFSLGGEGIISNHMSQSNAHTHNTGCGHDQVPVLELYNINKLPAVS